MRYIALLFSMNLLVWAGVLDFYHLRKAQEAYRQGSYQVAEKEYAVLKSDEAKYNRANSLYKAKKYQEALGLYKSINSRDLEFKKLHNIGNALAHLSKIDEAIKAYEQALKIKEDKETRFNLNLLKKEKKKQQQKKQQNKNKQNKNNKNSKQNKNNQRKDNSKKENRENKQQQNNQTKRDENSSKQKRQQQQNSQKQKQQEQQKQKQKEKEKKQEQSKPQETKKEKAKREKEQKQKAMQAQKMKQQKNLPISDMEERKWQKLLNQKEVNTLMLPLKKGEKKNETTPW